ncbi:8312_t:CDS:2 [Gigaspora rosea]|nr:8312_t:CDS:2 [Gigaspora rosea]
MLDYEDIDNYHLSQTFLVDIIEVLVECDEFNVDSLYKITDNELLPEVSVDSDESDIEVSINSVLENMFSDFKGFDSEYGPYFPNFTSATIFTWVPKHMVSTSEYEDLVKIITHPEFHTKDVPKNIWQVQKWRNRLPLVETSQHDRVLNNPALMPEMYFGPGVVTKEKQKFWHGELWQDSLLFGEYETKNNEELYRAGDCLIYYQQSTAFMCRVRGVIVDEMDNDLLKLKVDQILLYKIFLMFAPLITVIYAEMIRNCGWLKNNEKVKSVGLSKNLDINHPFFQDLCKTYADYLNSSTILINKKLEFYNSITYTVLESDQDSVQVKLRVGDFVELLEETEGITYAEIESIFRHQANND